MRETIVCGQEAASFFALEPGYRNLNHGSYGTYPLPVREALRRFQERAEARPDAFVRYEYRTHLLDDCRHAIEDYLHAQKDTCVFVPNATNGIETILRNIEFKDGDIVVAFATIYEAFANTLKYLAQKTPLDTKIIDYTLPVSDDFLCDALEWKIESTRAVGLRPRLVLFDTINALPAVRMPFERLTRLCRKHGVLSCIDGAHGIGQIPLNVQDLDPDFLVTNCHKWLYTPRGCGVLYVPFRNQPLLQSTIPTGFGFGRGFVENFANIGTLDDSPYLCVPAALSWRKLLTWQGKLGDEAITAYMLHLAREGGAIVANILGTEILENEDETLGRCAFANVRLPLNEKHATEDAKTSRDTGSFIMQAMITKRNTSVNVFPYAGVWWVRLSAPVYLTLEDFRVGGRHLKEICENVNQRAVIETQQDR